MGGGERGRGGSRENLKPKWHRASQRSLAFRKVLNQRKHFLRKVNYSVTKYQSRQAEKRKQRKFFFFLIDRLEIKYIYRLSTAAAQRIFFFRFRTRGDRKMFHLHNYDQ